MEAEALASRCRRAANRLAARSPAHLPTRRPSGGPGLPAPRIVGFAPGLSELLAMAIMQGLSSPARRLFVLLTMEQFGAADERRQFNVQPDG